MTEISKSSKIILGIVIVLVAGVLGWIAYYWWKDKSLIQNQTSPSPTATLGSIKTSPTLSLSASPKPSPQASPSPSSNVEYKVPAGETYLLSSKADTNDDGKEETLVITDMQNSKFHAYILSSTGDLLFENKELIQKPLRIAIQKYDESENFSSWMLIFTEQSGNLLFIHWNGSQYEIPESLGI